MPDPLLVARNPDPDSSLPFLVRIPLGDGIVLRARETWPRASKVYCHRHDKEWSDDLEIVETTPLRSVTRRGAAIDIVANRTRESHSQFVLTKARGREMIFWQNARVAKAARPNIDLPTARGSGVGDLEIVVDTREKYAWKFGHQQASTVKRALPVGDYGMFVEDELIAVVERKGLGDLSAALSGGRMAYRLSALEAVPRAAVVVEHRYSEIFKLSTCDRHWWPTRWLNVRSGGRAFPSFSQEWTYRFLAAALQEHRHDDAARRALPAGD